MVGIGPQCGPHQKEKNLLLISRMRRRVVVLAADVAGQVADNGAAHGAGLRAAPHLRKGPPSLSMMGRPSHWASVTIGAVMVDLRAAVLPLHVTPETSPC